MIRSRSARLSGRIGVCALPALLTVACSGSSARVVEGDASHDASGPLADAVEADAGHDALREGGDGASDAGDVDGDSRGDAGAARSDGAPDARGDARRDDEAGCPIVETKGGVIVPACWTLHTSDRFGTGAGETVANLTELHAKYYEGQQYNRDASGLVDIPNVVINMEQETYVHFEQAVVFADDHLTIQGRGHSDNSITSAELVSRASARSFCVEARYTIPSTDKSWPAFWFYGDATGHDASEIDVEQPVTPNQGVDAVSMHNHPEAPDANVTVFDSLFTTAYETWTNPAFNASTAPHIYTACYDDAVTLITRYIDGEKIYAAVWQWNASLGGTGKGPDASTIVNLAVGGTWPGNVADPATYVADLDVYWVDYYGP